MVDSNVSVTGANGTGIEVDRISLAGALDLAVKCSHENAINGVSISLTPASITGRTNTTRFFGVSPSISRGSDALIFYSRTSADSEERLAKASIEIGNFALEDGLVWEVTFTAVGGTWQRTTMVDSSAVKRLFLTVQVGHNYTVTARSGDTGGILMAGNESVFRADSSTLFLSEVHLADFPSPTRSPTQSATISRTVSSTVSPAVSETPADNTVRDWKIAFGVVAGVMGVVIVGLVVLLVVIRRRPSHVPHVSTLPLDSTPMSYD
jgi:hypothetical protein